MKKIFTVILTLTLFVATSFAQMARLYNMQHGLNTTRLDASYIDNDGLLWIMGDHCLSFFDGKRFHDVIEEKSDFANRVSVVHSMLQVGDHQYLVGTAFGLYLLDSRTYQFTQISLGEMKGVSHMPGFPVSSVRISPSGEHAIVTTMGYGSKVIRLGSYEIDQELSKKFNSVLEDQFVYTTMIDSHSTIWVSTSLEPIVRIDTKTYKKLKVNIAPELKEIINNGCPIQRICEDPKTNNVLMGAPGLGLLIYDKSTNTIREIQNNIRNINPLDIIFTKLGDIFVGSDNKGILQYDRKTESIYPIEWEVLGLDLKVSKVHHFAEDSDGNLIATLYQNGILIVPSHINKMTYIPVSRTNNGTNSSPIASLFRMKNHYWIGTDGSGMFQADYMRFRDVRNVSTGLNMLQMTSVVSDANDNIWASTYGGGVQMYNGTEWVTPSYVEELSNKNVLSLISDKKTNSIFVCINGSGLYEININEQKTTKIDIPEIGNRWLAHAYIDSKRNMWVIFASGLCRINIDTRQANSFNLSSLLNSQINDITEYKNKIYFATSKGLASYSYKADTIMLEEKVNEMLSERNVMSVQPVKDNMWLALAHGVSCIGEDDKVIANYTAFPGFYIGELHRHCKLVAHEGFVCFGGDNGIVAISTNTTGTKEQHIAKLLVTGLSVNGKQVVYNPESEKNILDGSIISVNKITLENDQNSFSINFGSTEYVHADEIEYEYMLDGYEDIWHLANANNASAYYSSVPAGNYTFRIRAHFNYSNEYIEKSIKVKVLPPLYATWWAILIYLIIAAACAWYAWRFYKERHEAKAKLRQLEHAEQIKEAKLRLFTSIAHELRTPLTMIISPLKQLKTNDKDQEHQKLYTVMQRNCDRLLNIVKQITDVRKIDNGQLHLHFSEIEFVKYCNEIMASFASIASAKNIQFSHFCDEETITMWADPVHFEKIIINILSNAFKFTPSDGKILIRTECKKNDGTFSDKKIADYLFVSIYNSGSHIDEKDIDHIYERFYQGAAGAASIGSGIGLNLTYELTKLHHGIIKVRNVDNEGVEFTLNIPLGKNHLSEEELKPREAELTSEQASNKTQIDTLASAIATEQNVESKEGEESKAKRHVLIVDDDKEICEYMCSQLESEFNVTVCFSGNSAWKQVLALRPDVVVTDLIMPDGDGYTLCRQIKQNPETGHIPIIMLTAENNEQSHLLSMSAEVDHFLSKPFNIELLRGALRQVLRVRENLINKMHRTDVNADYQDVEMESYEDKFFTKINEIIKRNLDDSNFTVEALAREVGISRVHLNRKLKEHYGLSPNAFIRSVRLKQAAYLLVNNKVNISEVAYKVGFASHSYFSNNFHEYFGMTPTEFVAYYSNGINDEQLKKLLE